MLAVKKSSLIDEKFSSQPIAGIGALSIPSIQPSFSTAQSQECFGQAVHSKQDLPSFCFMAASISNPFLLSIFFTYCYPLLYGSDVPVSAGERLSLPHLETLAPM